MDWTRHGADSWLTWSLQARADLHRTDEYLGSHDPQAAVDALHAICSTLARLRDCPRVGRGVRDPFRVFGVRRTDYLMLYRVDDVGLEILRIRHGHENWLGEIEEAP